MGRNWVEFAKDTFEPRNEGGQDTREALNVLRRLDAIAARVSRLELCLQKQRAFWRRDIKYATIITALITLCGLLGFGLIWRLV
jgi:hypothetical protein